MRRGHSPPRALSLAAFAAPATSAASALGLFAAAAALAASVEVYGRPLRGLTLVPISDLARGPERFEGREVRVAGNLVRLPGGQLGLADGKVSLPLSTPGFTLPETSIGRRAAAEGKVQSEDKERQSPARFVAAGVEVTR